MVGHTLLNTTIFTNNVINYLLEPQSLLFHILVSTKANKQTNKKLWHCKVTAQLQSFNRGYAKQAVVYYNKM